MELTFRAYDLPLQHPFTISRYTVTVQKTMIVTIGDGEFSGFGEATANPYYSSTIEKLSASLAKVKPIIESSGQIHPQEMWQRIAPLLANDYFALCAVDIAYWDFYARRQKKGLHEFWSNGKERLPLTSYTIAIDTIDSMKAKIIEKPWPIYKIKLGTSNDIQIVESLRKITDSVFRIDANCAWTVDQAIGYAGILKQLNVEFIEQPLKADDVVGMRKVISESPLPIIADESCQKEQDVIKCYGLFNGINIKLMKCGGLTPALRMIATARSLNLSLMAGCMTESTVGISALAQLAPLLDYIDSDGALLLAKDVASGVHFDFGKIIFQNLSGSGAKLL
jgi:L-Ala-D/L-Glu epimerase